MHLPGMSFANLRWYQERGPLKWDICLDHTGDGLLTCKNCAARNSILLPSSWTSADKRAREESQEYNLFPRGDARPSVRDARGLEALFCAILDAGTKIRSLHIGISSPPNDTAYPRTNKGRPHRIAGLPISSLLKVCGNGHVGKDAKAVFQDVTELTLNLNAYISVSVDSQEKASAELCELINSAQGLKHLILSPNCSGEGLTEHDIMQGVLKGLVLPCLESVRLSRHCYLAATYSEFFRTHNFSLKHVELHYCIVAEDYWAWDGVIATIEVYHKELRSISLHGLLGADGLAAWSYSESGKYLRVLFQVLQRAREKRAHVGRDIAESAVFWETCTSPEFGWLDWQKSLIGLKRSVSSGREDVSFFLSRCEIWLEAADWSCSFW